MYFTALHRALGIEPSDLTDEILDAAVEVGVEEAHDLDWKSELPPTSSIAKSDFPKDLAAMANVGGGMIVYGVKELGKSATQRVHVGEFTEGHERTIRHAAITAITPPLFGLGVHELGSSPRAVAIVVPPSMDGPHLIYRGELFGAPIRNDADTVWMKEREIEAMYRSRFDERSRAAGALGDLYAEAVRDRDVHMRAWLIAVANPRIPRPTPDLDRVKAIEVFESARNVALTNSTDSPLRPLSNLSVQATRPGLRRWVAPNGSTGSSDWRQAWASVHRDGAVTLSSSVGGQRSTTRQLRGYQFTGQSIEFAIADFMALMRSHSSVLHQDEYDIQIGVEYTGEYPLQVFSSDNSGLSGSAPSASFRGFTPVRSTVLTACSDDQFHRQVHELAEDCVNQCGITYLREIKALDEN